MYDCDCPYCKKTNTFWEIGGCINKYIPRVCEHCGKTFYYNLQRSWFDPYYDNSNVEIRKQEWIDKKVENKELAEWGSMKNQVGKVVAYIYNPLWDIYEEYGGEEEVFAEMKKRYSEEEGSDILDALRYSMMTRPKMNWIEKTVYKIKRYWKRLVSKLSNK